MLGDSWDAVIVGARCAGSPMAMLLARKGYKVLLVDKARFPSDTISTHLVHPPGIAALKRWGLFDRLVSTGCPPIDTYAFDFGPFTISGSPGIAEAPAAFAPRRTVLDKILVDAAAEAGARVREGFAVEEVVFDGDRATGIRGRAMGRNPVMERAGVVIGADGLLSLVARSVQPEQYNEKPRLLAGYYTYFSGLPVNGRFETFLRPYRGITASPTHDGLTLVIAGWPYAEFEANKKDIEGNYFKTIERVPAFADRVRAAKREARFVGGAVPNYFRKPYGPGWVLVGDAGYNKDFITAQGISDAFRDAELCSNALDGAFSGRTTFDAAMANYQSVRDAHALPMYEFTAHLATLEPPSPELQRILAAVSGSKEATDDFARVNAGVLSPLDFFSEENIGRIFAAAS